MRRVRVSKVEDVDMPFDGVDGEGKKEDIDPRLAALERVREMLPHGGYWVQETYKTPGGRYCLKEVFNLTQGDLLVKPILRAAQLVTHQEFFSIEGFNDDPKTTFAIVKEVLDLTWYRIVTGAEPAYATAETATGELRRQVMAAAFFGLVFFSSFLRAVF